MKILRECDLRAGNPLLIAELGTSHGGDIVKAREMIAAAGEAGAGCVKFQMVFADEILHPDTGEVALPGGKIRLYDRFKQLESPVEFFAEVKEYAEARGLLFLCTPFGLKSADLLRQLNPKIVKIASPELNYTRLLEHISQWGLPVLLSSGVSLLGDIEEALAALHFHENETGQAADGVPVCLLHCVTSYPAPETDYNLRVLKNLSGIFGVPAGVSDHSMDPELVPVLALGQGAAVIEKHFCLSRGDSGLDDPIALPPPLFARMVQAVRAAQKAGPEETLAALIRERGGETIERILGTGVKRLAPSERANYRRTNRSLHALRDIAEGEIIGADDIGVFRTEKILRPGLPPRWETLVAGRKARSFIPRGEGIRFQDI
ncbi:MAG TPA: spore coat protein [Treponema sp.]|nr:spore coat protein [Treponema sp.]